MSPYTFVAAMSYIATLAAYLLGFIVKISFDPNVIPTHYVQSPFLLGGTDMHFIDTCHS